MEVIFRRQYHSLNCVLIILSDGSREVEARVEKIDDKWHGTLWERPNQWTKLIEGERDEVAKVIAKKVIKLCET